MRVLTHARDALLVALHNGFSGAAPTLPYEQQTGHDVSLPLKA
jgi:hypothetical protein